MRWYLLAAVFAASVSNIPASSWRPSERLLTAVRWVESCDGLFLYGDHGRSLGEFQLSEAAWLDVSLWRRGHGFRSYAYRRYVMNPQINRIYAADYLTIIHDELLRKLRREPTPGEMYAAYNMGLGSFASCRYRLARVNPITARKCQQINQALLHNSHRFAME